MDKKKVMLNNMYGIQLAKTNVSDPKEMEEIINDIFAQTNSEEWITEQIKIREKILDDYNKICERRGYNNPFKDTTIKRQKTN